MMKGDGAKHELGESESDQTGAKQKKTCNGHSQKPTGSKLIPHGTPPFACPVLEWKDCAGAQSNAFLSSDAVSDRLMF
jgi:hypothetical protein